MVNFMLHIFFFTNISTTTEPNPTEPECWIKFTDSEQRQSQNNLFDVITSYKAHKFTLKGSFHSVFTTPNKKPSS